MNRPLFSHNHDSSGFYRSDSNLLFSLSSSTSISAESLLSTAARLSNSVSLHFVFLQTLSSLLTPHLSLLSGLHVFHFPPHLTLFFFYYLCLLCCLNPPPTSVHISVANPILLPFPVCVCVCSHPQTLFPLTNGDLMSDHPAH